VDSLASEVSHLTFWWAALKIIGINILLSGDNAVVIALACRELPPRQRFWGMVLGAGVAAVLLILFTGVVATLMELPYLKLVGGVALFWVAIKLVAPQPHDQEDTPQAVEDLWRAVRVVVVANIVMSLDNVIAVAAAANGDYILLGLGLAVSIPIVIAGSALFLAILNRFPWVVWAGGALLGWIAGNLLPDDPVVAQFIARRYGMAITPSWWPHDAEAIANYIAGKSVVSFDVAYSWFEHAGKLRLEFVLEPWELAFSLLGSIIVVGAGLRLLRASRAAEADAIASS
jgi:YjbE family integral membrane protein